MAEIQHIVEAVTRLAEPLVRDELLELVDVEFHPAGGRWLLRIYIDKEGGVTIRDCERVSRELERILDVEDVIDHPYTLEVSSPGLTRALKKKNDFEKYRGKRCRIVTSSPIESRYDFEGEIGEVTGESVEIITESKTNNWAKTNVYAIPFCAIKKAHLEFEL